MVQMYALCVGYKDTQMVCTAKACYTRENLDRDILPRALGCGNHVARARHPAPLTRPARGDAVLWP